MSAALDGKDVLLSDTVTLVAKVGCFQMHQRD